MGTTFTLRHTNFAVEFAKFVDFVGAAELHDAIGRVLTKLQGLPPCIVVTSANALP
jgi:hypothetical protein